MFRSFLKGIRNRYIPFPYCFGFSFVKKYKFLQTSQYWTPEQLKKYKWKALKHILNHAYNNVPYYNQEWKKIGVSPDDICSFEDMKRLPVLTKLDVMNNSQTIQARNLNKYKPTQIQSSGSTGTPVSILLSKSMNQWEKAFVWRYFTLGGYYPSDRVLYTRGKVIPSKNNPPYEINSLGTECYISTFHLSESTLSYYFDIIQKFKPTVWRTYPSCIPLITEYAKKYQIKVPSLKAIFTSSETLTNNQREMAERYWKCQVFDWYGQAERSSGIFSCKYNRYHINEDYSFNEYLSLGNNRYELISTSFYNEAMPLIRYKTNDIIIKGSIKAQCECNRSFPIINRIDGRRDDYIVVENRGSVGTAALSLAFKSIKGVVYSQLIQNTMDNVIVKLVITDEFNSYAKSKLDNELIMRLGDKINIDYQFVDSIERTEAGKLRFIISKL